MTQLSVKFVVAITLFIAFSIGLNLGLHGVILFENTDFVRAVNSKDNKNQPVNPSESNEVLDVIDALPPTIPAGTTINLPSVTENQVDPLSIKLQMVDDKVKLRLKESMKYTNVKEEKITTYMQQKNNIPVVLLTCNRPQLLRETLESLLKVRGITVDQILISQDGDNREVADVARSSGITLIQNIADSARLRGLDGGARIAQHYKYSLSAAFDRHPDAPAVIVIEDDLLFSPDFLEYFRAVAPVLDEDLTTFVVSAWSDNGFKDKVRDPYALRRTDYFPGLGWMLTRKLYKGELEAQWPREHWDHWLRSAAINKNREIVFPQVPRTFHNGIKGTFMNLETHNRYFRDIGYNTDSNVAWATDGSAHMQAEGALYEYRIEQLVATCVHVNAVTDLLEYSGEVLCLWINLNPVSEWQPPEFQPVSEFFGLWHEHRRGSHRLMHEFHWQDNYVLLLNTHGSGRADSRERTYAHLKPIFARTLEPKEFDKGILMQIRRRRTPMDTQKASGVGMSCDQVCSEVGKACVVEHLRLLNSCEVLQEQFGCTSCLHSMGAEQPAYVSLQAAAEFSPGRCLVNSLPEHSTCAASHQATIRLCACGNK